MRRRKIAAEIFAIEPGNHAEAWGLGKIQGKTNRDDRSGHFQQFRFAYGEGGRGHVSFQHCHSATHIGQNLARRICFAFKFNREIFRLAANGVRRVERAGGVDKKSGAEYFTVLINSMDLDDGFGRAFENIFNLATDGASGLVLRRDS